MAGTNDQNSFKAFLVKYKFMSLTDIKYLFEPRSVAIIGASHDPDKVGHKILENIIAGGFKGKIFPVNYQGGKILGLTVYQSVLKIKEEIDLALIAIPAKSVFEAVKECAAKKIKFLVIVASGFSEAGKTEEEKKIVNFAREKGMRILGPNVFGIYSSRSSLTATFGAKVEKPGNVAIISQSGALGIALMGKTETEGIGLSSIIFEGNKADLEEKDLLPYFLTDEQTKVIFIHLEGVKNGKELVFVLKELTAKKPVVVLKAGTTAKGAQAAISHTGSLSGEKEVFFAAMKQCGVIQAENLQEAIDWSKFLASAPVPKGENVVIITNGGGMGILATDACEKYQLGLYEDSLDLQRTFCTIIPDFGSCQNPVDITGQAKAENYQKILERALEDTAVHSVICLGCETAVLDNQKLTEVLVDIYRKYQKAGKPITFAFIGGKEVEEKLLSLRRKGLPIFSETEEAVSCLGALYQHYHNLKRGLDKTKPLAWSASAKKISQILGKAKKEERSLLYPQEAGEIMELIGISSPKSLIVLNENQAARLARKIGFPVVMKVVSKDIVHKTEAGGVILDLQRKEQVIKAYQRLMKNVKKYDPKARIEGVAISETIKGGIEVIVGAKKDRDFGTIVMVGLGGIYAEALKDISFRTFPLSLEEAEGMIQELRSSRLFRGVRGEKEKDIHKLGEVILKLGAMVENCPAVTEVEINPLKIFEKGKGIKALDTRILVG